MLLGVVVVWVGIAGKMNFSTWFALCLPTAFALEAGTSSGVEAAC